MYQSVYLKFCADKLSYMSGCEAGPDPVNSPDEVYKRYGGEDEPYEKVSGGTFINSEYLRTYLAGGNGKPGE